MDGLEGVVYDIVGFAGRGRMWLYPQVVEAAGIEPASEYAFRKGPTRLGP